jgi:hypothetical protein
MNFPSVKMVERSENAKTGPVANTFVSQATCPRDCPLRDAGCYAQHGPIGLITRGLNRSRDSAARAAEREAAAIDALNPHRVLDLRVHVVGDCRDSRSAALVGGAMARFQARSGRGAWTYTHAWRDIPAVAWQGASVIASCETVEQVREARARGYATALVLPRKGAAPKGIKAVACRHEAKGTQCVDCRRCLDAKGLHKRGETVVFHVHGTRFKTVSRMLEKMAR